MPHTLQLGERYTGQMGLIRRFGLAVPLPAVVSIVGAGQRRTVVDCGRTVERYTTQYDYGDTAVDDLRFALRYEPLDTGVLNAAFRSIDPMELAEWIRASPTGAYARRAWFLYERFVGKALDIPDAGRVASVPALDPEKHIVAAGMVSRRHRVLDNLLGTPALCPVVRRTKKLDQAMASGIAAEAKILVESSDPQILLRAVNYLYTKETKSSFAIEGEAPDASRTERFIAVLKTYGDFDLTAKDDYLRLQNRIVDPRYGATDWRNFQNFVGETVGGYQEVVHYICPRPEHVAGMMEGLWAMAEKLAPKLVNTLEALLSEATGNSVDPVIAAAVIAFAFVFIHPFEDGNGRIHRFLIHRILAAGGVTPPGVLFPVSAVMQRNRAAYDAALESVSAVIKPFVEWGWSNREEGAIVVKNDPIDRYRFFDATAIAEYLYDCVIESVRKDLREEITFVEVFDRALTGVKERVDMPDRKAVLFVRTCLQNEGRLTRNQRERSFPELTDGEVADLERIVGEAISAPRQQRVTNS